MADPQGQMIDLPIQSNLREGLSLTEYLKITPNKRNKKGKYESYFQKKKERRGKRKHTQSEMSKCSPLYALSHSISRHRSMKPLLQ